MLNHWQEPQRNKMCINESSRHVQTVAHRVHVPHNNSEFSPTQNHKLNENVIKFCLYNSVEQF